MHRAWDVDDIWQVISDYLSRQDLKALALTCSHFAECASDTLWREVTNPIAFVCRLPADWRDRPLTTQDVARLDQRFSNVRTITFHRERLPKGFEHSRQLAAANKIKNWNMLWSEISALRPQVQAFPDLRTVDVNTTHRDVLIPLIGISGRHLVSLDMHVVYGKKRPSVGRDFVHATHELVHSPARDADSHLGFLSDRIQSPLDAIQLRPRLHAPDVDFARLKLRGREMAISRQLSIMPRLSRFQKHLQSVQDRFYDWHRCLSPLEVLTAYYLANADSAHDADDEEHRGPNVDLSRLRLRDSSTTTSDLDSDGVRPAMCNEWKRPRKQATYLADVIMSIDGWSDLFTTTAWDTLQQGQTVTHSLQTTLPNLRSLELSKVPRFLERYDPVIYRAYADQMPSLEQLRVGPWNKPLRRAWATSDASHKQGKLVSMRHLAAFLSMLSALKSVDLPRVIVGSSLDTSPIAAYASQSVTSIDFSCLAALPEEYATHVQTLKHNLSTYFPNARHASNSIEVWFFRTLGAIRRYPDLYTRCDLPSWHN